MPWKERSIMSERLEFVYLALQEGANRSDLCRRFGISRETGYKWIKRFEEEGVAGLEDESRRPHTSPNRTSEEMERLVLKAKREHSAWGGRKVRTLLIREGYEGVPSASTITEIFRREGLLDRIESVKHKPWQRFERESPNELWQMDFKGHFAMREGRCHPLTVLDDHSRFNVGLWACGNEQAQTVKEHLTQTFRIYGLPEYMLVDNGAPWGQDGEHPYTFLTVWLLRLGVQVIHSGAYHPQTGGKDERFHRTLKAEVLQGRFFQNLPHVQAAFDQWRPIYNCQRPHEGIGMEVPASRYRPSERLYPEQLPPIEYAPGDIVRKVQNGGWVHFHNHVYRVGKAFYGYPVALRPTETDGLWTVFFMTYPIILIDERTDPQE